MVEIKIPEKHEGKLVTAIGEKAFENCDSLKSITIPDSVRSIGTYAFRDCSSLASITLPFIGMSKEGTTNTHFGYIFGASSYETNKDYVPTSLKTVVITGGTSIGDWAFRDCRNLESITIPDSVTSIGNYAFMSCSSLTSIAIGDGVTSIGGGAFSHCLNLMSIEIPDSVTSIGKFAFYYCTSLKSITLPFVGATKDGTTNTHFGYIFGADTYENNNSDVPNSLTTVKVTG
jgi:hypothetical protein